MNEGEGKEESVEVGAEIMGPVFIDGAIHFSPKDLLRYDLIRVKIESTAKDLDLLQKEDAIARLLYEKKIRELQDRQNVLNARMHQLKAESDRIRGLVEAKYHLDMTKVAYDDVTGKLTRLDTGQPQN
jgi:cell division protein FtsB